MPGPAPRRHGIVLATLAAAIHLSCDALSSRSPITSPPYLLLDHAGDLFRELLALDRTAILVAVAVAAAAVNGAISAMLAIAMEGIAHRRRKLAWVLFAFWVFSGGLMILVYFRPPWAVVAGSLAAGLPRTWLVAWALDRALGAPVLDRAAPSG